FFFSSRRRHTILVSDWSSDVCSSDLMRFGDYWRVLLAHLIMFGFVYPDKRQNVPAWVTDELIRRLTVSRPNLQSDICYGTLLSRSEERRVGKEGRSRWWPYQ